MLLKLFKWPLFFATVFLFFGVWCKHAGERMGRSKITSGLTKKRFTLSQIWNA